MISIARNGHERSAIVFTGVGFALMAFSAIFASLAPLAFSIATVFLFAGPHNWVELRYFLSRLPARFAKLRTFFWVSFGGLACLVSLYLTVLLLFQCGSVSDSVLHYSLMIWNLLLIGWIVCLIMMTGCQRRGRDWDLALPVGLAACALSAVSPQTFWLLLVYAHPFMGLWILDRELARNNSAWRQAYHRCLACVPFLLAAIWVCLARSPQLVQDTPLTWQITQHAGAALLPGISSHLLVSTHTFLEMLHYGVWLLAIPLVSAGWQSFRPRSIPVACRSAFSRRAVSIVLAVSTLLVFVLWSAFAMNFAAARELYFTIAIVHVLAEIPFLLKSLI